MANIDNPHGFIAETALGTVGNIPIWGAKLLSNTIIEPGDALSGQSGYACLTNVITTDSILGVSLSAQATSVTTNQDILFHPALDFVVFSGQCSGTPTQALVWTNCDIEGTTGIMEINENASTYSPVRLIGLKPGSSMGLNAEMLFVWNKSAFTGKGLA